MIFVKILLIILVAAPCIAFGVFLFMQILQYVRKLNERDRTRFEKIYGAQSRRKRK
ncbi:MAG: hypothetical protein IJH90_09925 [Mogibacterium sp.]|nr:hypothetical protein [Mogibacterium sp.]